LASSSSPEAVSSRSPDSHTSLAAVFGLANWIEPWLSALIIGAIIVIIGIVMLMKGRSNMRASNLAPDRTLDSARKDAELAKSEVSR
jgi:hypothetical protein